MFYRQLHPIFAQVLYNDEQVVTPLLLNQNEFEETTEEALLYRYGIKECLVGMFNKYMKVPGIIGEIRISGKTEAMSKEKRSTCLTTMTNVYSYSIVDDEFRINNKKSNETMVKECLEKTMLIHKFDFKIENIEIDLAIKYKMYNSGKNRFYDNPLFYAEKLFNFGYVPKVTSEFSENVVKEMKKMKKTNLIKEIGQINKDYGTVFEDCNGKVRLGYNFTDDWREVLKAAESPIERNGKITIPQSKTVISEFTL